MLLLRPAPLVLPASQSCFFKPSIWRSRFRTSLAQDARVWETIVRARDISSLRVRIANSAVLSWVLAVCSACSAETRRCCVSALRSVSLFMLLACLRVSARMVRRVIERDSLCSASCCFYIVRCWFGQPTRSRKTYVSAKDEVIDDTEDLSHCPSRAAITGFRIAEVNCLPIFQQSPR